VKPTVVCPKSALESCEDIIPLDDPSFDALKRKTGEIAGLLGICKFKHEVLKECFEASQPKEK
jgi:hypothetical protein